MFFFSGTSAITANFLKQIFPFWKDRTVDTLIKNRLAPENPNGWKLKDAVDLLFEQFQEIYAIHRIHRLHNSLKTEKTPEKKP